MQFISYQNDGCLLLVRRAMPAGLCFADVTFFFKMSPLSFDNGWTDCCVNTVHGQITAAKNVMFFSQGTLPWQPILWCETATSWHTSSLLFVLAFYNGLEYPNADCCINIDDDSSTSVTNFV